MYVPPHQRNRPTSNKSDFDKRSLQEHKTHEQVKQSQDNFQKIKMENGEINYSWETFYPYNICKKHYDEDTYIKKVRHNKQCFTELLDYGKKFIHFKNLIIELEKAIEKSETLKLSLNKDITNIEKKVGCNLNKDNRNIVDSINNQANFSVIHTLVEKINESENFVDEIIKIFKNAQEIFQWIVSPQYILTKCTDIMPYVLESKKNSIKSETYWYRIYYATNCVDICSDNEFHTIVTKFEKIEEKYKIIIDDNNKLKYNSIKNIHKLLKDKIETKNQPIKYEIVVNSESTEILETDSEDLLSYDDQEDTYDMYYD